MLRERITFAASDGSGVVREALDASLEHLPGALRAAIASGGRFVELGDRSGEIAALIGMPVAERRRALAARAPDRRRAACGARARRAAQDLRHARRRAASRPRSRCSSSASRDCGSARRARRRSRTLEDVTQRVHGEYVRTPRGARARRRRRRGPAARPATPPSRRRPWPPNERRRNSASSFGGPSDERTGSSQQLASLDRAERAGAARSAPSQRGAAPDRADAATCSTGSSHSMRSAHEPRQLVDGLLALVGDDMQAQRCSLMLRAPEPGDAVPRRRARARAAHRGRRARRAGRGSRRTRRAESRAAARARRAPTRARTRCCTISTSRRGASSAFRSSITTSWWAS